MSNSLFSRLFKTARRRSRGALTALLMTGMLSMLFPNRVPAAAPTDDALIYRSVASNADNFVAFIRDDKIFKSGLSRVTLLVKPGDEAPGTDGGKFEHFTSLALNTSNFFGQDNSTLVFRATVTGGKNSEGIFSISQNRLAQVVLTGNTAPETGGGHFSHFSDKLAVTNDVFLGLTSGVIVFHALVEGGKSKDGIFATRAEVVSAVAVQGDPASGSGGGTISSFGDFTINDIGLVAFVANIAGGGDLTQGIFLGFPIPLGIPLLFVDITLPAALNGQPAPGGRGAKYAKFDHLVLNTDSASFNLVNQLAFRATLVGGEPTAPKEGLFQVAFLAIIPVANSLALRGQEAPQADHGKFASFSHMAANNQNTLSFVASVENGSTPGGIFQVTMGPLTLLSKSLDVGAVAPDTNGGKFASFCSMSISENGRAVFDAKISKGNVPEAIFLIFAKQPRKVSTEP